MLKTISFITFVIFLAIPIVSYAGTAQKCEANCMKKCESLGSGEKYEGCLENCLIGCYDNPSGSYDSSPEMLNTTDGKSKKIIENVRRKYLKWVPCFIKRNSNSKDDAFIQWCSTLYPWTTINDTQTTCYSTLEDCVKNETSQSKCIKCEIKNP